MFQTEAWFQTLLAHGFERRPHQHALRLDAAGEVRLYLMRAKPGAPLSSLSNYYSSLYAPVGPVVGLRASDWAQAVQSLRQLPGSAVVQLQPLAQDSEWLPALEAALRRSGYRTDRYFCFGNWYQPVQEGGFDGYWRDRPPALRNSIERGRRRLAGAGVPWRIDVITKASDERLPGAIRAFQAVYGQSWKQPEPCPGFMPNLIQTAAEQGWLRLGVLWLGDDPVAAQVWMVYEGKTYIYKLAYVKGREKLSAGSVLTAELMRYAMDVDRVNEVDYLTGDDAYKADWMSCRRERVGLIAFDQRRPAGWLAALRHSAGRALRCFRNF